MALDQARWPDDCTGLNADQYRRGTCDENDSNPERLELRTDRRGLPPTRRLAVLQHVARGATTTRESFPVHTPDFFVAPRPLFLPLEIHTNSEPLENKEGWNLRDRFPHELKATRINVETDGKQPAWLYCRLVRGAPAPLLLAKAPSLTSLSLINITLFSVRQLPMHPPKLSLDMTLILVREGSYGHCLVIGFDGISGGGGGTRLGIQGGELLLQLHDPRPFQRADRHGRQVCLPPRHLRDSKRRRQLQQRGRISKKTSRSSKQRLQNRKVTAVRREGGASLAEQTQNKQTRTIGREGGRPKDLLLAVVRGRHTHAQADGLPTFVRAGSLP